MQRNGLLSGLRWTLLLRWRWRSGRVVCVWRGGTEENGRGNDSVRAKVQQARRRCHLRFFPIMEPTSIAGT